MKPRTGQPNRVDGNQRDMIGHFERLGFAVVDIHDIGQGCPDLIVSLHGQNVLVEIKNNGRKLSPIQECFADYWKGPIFTASCLDDVIKLRTLMIEVD